MDSDTDTYKLKEHIEGSDADTLRISTRRSRGRRSIAIVEADSSVENELGTEVNVPRATRSNTQAYDGSKGKPKQYAEKDLCQPLSIKTEETDGVGSKRRRSQHSAGRISSVSPAPISHACSPNLNKLNPNRRDRALSKGGRGEEKPDEVFRKDLISAMKLPDTEHLSPEQYLPLADAWRQDWERGVQVPVALESLPELDIRILPENEMTHIYGAYGFKLPLGKKFLHAVKDENYKSSIHELHESHKLAEDMCRYDVDGLDTAWLSTYNQERVAMGEEPLEEWVMETVMEELENQCYNNMQTQIKTVEGLGIEYDENIDCDVCKSPEGEEDNEMVFCDNCDICVHQACYGISTVPEGSWLCRLCALGMCYKTTPCVFCPNTGGAMKSTKSGTSWAHVSCAWWIPEVNFGNPEKMEPITNIAAIPESRWSLVCSVCRERCGACIQCSVKQCKTAFHVTCAFQDGLDMRSVIDEENEVLLLKGYCKKHTKKHDGTPKKGAQSPRHESTPKKEGGMTEKEKSQARSAKLDALSEEFYTNVNIKQIAEHRKFDEEVVEVISAYWKLKRQTHHGEPLITPKVEEAELLEKQRQDSLLSRMKMFIHLRQDLERVRNLCYMVTKREKMTRSVMRLKEQVFHQQLKCLGNREQQKNMPESHFSTIIKGHKIPSCVYDRYDFIKKQAKMAEDDQYAAILAKKAKVDFIGQTETVKERKKLKAKASVIKDQAKQVKQDKAKQALVKAKQLQAKAKQQAQKPLALKQTQVTKFLNSNRVKSALDSKTPKPEKPAKNIVPVLQEETQASGNMNVVKSEVINDILDSTSNQLTSSTNKSLSKRPIKLSEKAKAYKMDQLVSSTEKETQNLSALNPPEGNKKMVIAARSRKSSVRDKFANEKTTIESNGLFVFKKSDLIVPDAIKEHVQTRFELARQQRSLNNGICKHAQRVIPGFLKRKVSDLESIGDSPKKLIDVQSSHIKSSSAGEIKTRGVQLIRRLDSDSESVVSNDSSYYERVDDEVSIRSSRETTPDLFAGRAPARSPPRLHRKQPSHPTNYARMVLERQRRQRGRRATNQLSTESGEEADSESEESRFIDDDNDSDFQPFESDDNDFQPGSMVSFRSRKRSRLESDNYSTDDDYAAKRRDSRTRRRSSSSKAGTTTMVLPMSEDSQGSINDGASSIQRTSPRHKANFSKPFSTYRNDLW